MQCACACTHTHIHNFKITNCGDQNQSTGFVLAKRPSYVTQPHNLSPNTIIKLGPQFIIYTYESNYNTLILYNNVISSPCTTSEQHQMRKKNAELNYKFKQILF